jgi:hypothetical protein
VRQALAVALVWRLLMVALGVAAHYTIAPGPHLKSLIPRGSDPTPLTLILDPGVRNDAFWYARIVQHGYFFSTHRLSSIGFYPLYPMVVKALSLIFGDVYLSGMVASTVFLFLAVATLATWLEERNLGDRAALTTLLLLAFPFSFYYATMYPESLYLFLTLAAFVCYERGRWLPAAGAVSLLVLTRPNGVAILPCLVALPLLVRPRLSVDPSEADSDEGPAGGTAKRVATVAPSPPLGAVGTVASSLSSSAEAPPGGQGRSRSPYVGRFLPGRVRRIEEGRTETELRSLRTAGREKPLARVARFLPLVGGALGIAAFEAYQWVAFGTPFAYTRAKAVPPWSATPHQALQDLMLHGRYGIPSWFLAFNLAIGLAFLLCTPLVSRRLGLKYALLSALTVVISLFAGLPGLQRYVTVDFPVFAAAACWRRNLGLAAMIVVFLYAQAFFVFLWVAGIGIF